MHLMTRREADGDGAGLSSLRDSYSFLVGMQRCFNSCYFITLIKIGLIDSVVKMMSFSFLPKKFFR